MKVIEKEIGHWWVRQDFTGIDFIPYILWLPYDNQIAMGWLGWEIGYNYYHLK